MMHKLGAALGKLPEGQREAILLVGADGLSYEEAAQVLGCAVGTVKSRVDRAEELYGELMRLADEDGIVRFHLYGVVSAAERRSGERWRAE